MHVPPSATTEAEGLGPSQLSRRFPYTPPCHHLKVPPVPVSLSPRSSEKDPFLFGVLPLNKHLSTRKRQQFCKLPQRCPGGPSRGSDQRIFVPPVCHRTQGSSWTRCSTMEEEVLPEENFVFGPGGEFAVCSRFRKNQGDLAAKLLPLRM